MSPVSSSMPSSMPSSMLSDPFIYRLSQMCLKDPVVQSLYHNHTSWADIPSDDDSLELDDWESYNKIHTYAKTSYHQVYNARQRREQMRVTIKKQNNRSRTPYLTLKNNRFGPLRCDSPVSVSPAEMAVITLPIKELPTVQQTVVELPVVELPIEELPVVEIPLAEIPIEELPVVELPTVQQIVEELLEEPLEETLEEPLEETLEEPLKEETPTKKIIHIKKMSVHEKKYKEKEKQMAKKIHVISVPSRKKHFSFSAFFINLLVFSFIISSLMAGILVFM